jgi:hypothetical protein
VNKILKDAQDLQKAYQKKKKRSCLWIVQETKPYKKIKK